jgi:hypothetical protein
LNLSSRMIEQKNIEKNWKNKNKIEVGGRVIPWCA